MPHHPHPHDGPDFPHHPPHHHRHRPPHRPPPDPVAAELWKLVKYRGYDIEKIFAHIERRLGPGTSNSLKQMMATFGSPSVDDALEFIEASLRLIANAKREKLLGAAADKRVALVFPLPPHIHEEFLDLPDVQVLIPDGHPLPPHLRHLDVPIVDGTRQSRRAIRDSQFVVAEGYRHDGLMVGDVEVVEVVNEDCVAPDALVVGHLRHHYHEDDVPFTFPDSRVEFL